MTINYTSLLGLAQPVTGTESGTWGTVVNDEITALLEQAVAGGTSINVTAGDVTLTDTDGQSNQARNAILLITGTPGTTRNIIAPSTSKVYIIRNGSDSSVVLKGAATTGVTLLAGTEALCFWNGSDFEIAGVNGPTSSTDNAVARFDSTTGKVIQNSGVIIDDSNNVTGVVALTATGTVTGTKLIPTGGAVTGNGMYLPAANAVAITTNGANAIYIDSSQNVGIGTNSPGNKLHVNASGDSARFQGTSRSLYIAADTNASAIWNGASQTGEGVYLNAASNQLDLYTSSITRLRIDSSGNVGIGVTPTASSGAYKVLEVGASGNSIRAGTSDQDVYVTCNLYYNSGWKFGGNGYGALYNQYHGTHAWVYTPNNSSGAGASASLTTGMTLDAGGNLGIGTTSPYGRLDVTSTSAGNNVNLIFASNLSSTANTAVSIVLGAAADPSIRSAVIRGINSGSNAMNLAFLVSNGDLPEERARINSSGQFLVGKTADNVATAGARLDPLGNTFTVLADACAYFNRQNDDGVLVYFRQANTDEGSISVSGNTVSYNGFSGGHWTQLQQGRGYNPEIPRGTVMSTIGEMCEWKSVVWDEVIEHPAVPAVEAKEAVLDEEGNVIEPAVEAVKSKEAWTETIPHRKVYLGQLPVGATFTEDGVTKTVVDDGNERLPKVKISDVVGDKAVYGVFQTWDEVQDMLVTSLGAFVVRIAAGVTVQIGDLLESNGDGCAKVQDDDVIRSKTIGKVTSTTPTATYADGSYTVPCVLYCG